MRGSIPWLALLGCVAAPVAAQDADVRVDGARIRGDETSCWSSAAVPCDDVAHVALRVSAGRRALSVRLVRVEVARAEAPDAWEDARELRLSVHPAPAGARPRRAVRLAARRAHRLLVQHAPVRVAVDGLRYRVHLEVNGRAIVVPARVTVIYEHSDAEP